MVESEVFDISGKVASEEQRLILPWVRSSMYRLWLRGIGNNYGHMQSPLICVCVCVCSAPGILPLEASDQQEVSQEISSVHTSEREGWVKKDRSLCLCWCSHTYKRARMCVCVGRSIISRSVSTLQDIPEVMDELIERFGAESPGYFFHLRPVKSIQ